MTLWCPVCKRDTHYMLNPWQSEAGKMGAISALCRDCNRLEILVLGKGTEVVFDDEGDGMGNDECRKATNTEERDAVAWRWRSESMAHWAFTDSAFDASELKRVGFMVETLILKGGA
ncbi:MAG TPA: hypothetical protein VFH61_11775 [Thermoleophilia bacterium]|nr:hypothetical protein [Thermoleophilia bacterium]